MLLHLRGNYASFRTLYSPAATKPISHNCAEIGISSTQRSHVSLILPITQHRQIDIYFEQLAKCPESL